MSIFWSKPNGHYQCRTAGNLFRVHSSVAEHRIANPGVAGAIPAAPSFCTSQKNIIFGVRVGKTKDMTPEGIEPSTFGFGIRRATNYAMESKPRDGHWRGSEAALSTSQRQKKQKGPIGIRTRIGGFRVLSDSHYTIGPKSKEIATLGFH